MPINAHPEYLNAEKEYFQAQTPGEKLNALKKMISSAPKHKGAENLRAQLNLRYKKLKEHLEKSKKSGKSLRLGIKKEEMQAAIIGLTNSGKSSLLSALTNLKPEISEFPLKTKKSAVGIMSYYGTAIQLIEIPAINSKYYDKGISNTADILLILINSVKDMKKIEEKISDNHGKRIIIFNKIDLFSENEKRKIQATLSSKKYNFTMISTKTREGIEELKDKIFFEFGKIRVYTKEPGKEKSQKPILLDTNSLAENAAEKIFRGFAKKVKEIKIWGPSSSFPGQKVGLKHKLKDLDIIEFKTN